MPLSLMDQKEVAELPIEEWNRMSQKINAAFENNAPAIALNLAEIFIVSAEQSYTDLASNAEYPENRKVFTKLELAATFADRIGDTEKAEALRIKAENMVKTGKIPSGSFVMFLQPVAAGVVREPDLGPHNNYHT